MKKLLISIMGSLLLAGCASQQAAYDYTAFRESHPTSILVLPPVNHSPDVKAGNSLLSQSTMPLAESGYYVFPVSLTNETFRQNGMTVAEDIHSLPISKLHQIFGADTAKPYGKVQPALQAQSKSPMVVVAWLACWSSPSLTRSPTL